MKLKYQWAAPSDPYAMWKEHPPYNIFDTKSTTYKALNHYYAVEHIPVMVCDEGDTIASFILAGHYQFCCGLRELGRVDVSDVEDMPALVSFLHDNLCRGSYEYIGALTYTEVKDLDDNFVFGNEVNTFLNCWPNGNAAPWWFNPNSGNMVRIWTLPINQHKLEDLTEEEECLDDDAWDDEE